MIALAAFLMLFPPAPAAQTAPAAASGWTIRETNNATTGTRAATASIHATDGSGSRLIVRCDVVDMPVVTVQFIPKPAMPGGATRNVTMTFDNAKADTSAWQFPGAGGFVADPAEVYILATEIAAAKRIDVALYDESGAVIGATFDGPGSDALFRQVYTACGFPYAMPSAKPGGKS